MSPPPPGPGRDEVRYDTEDGALRSRSVNLVRRGKGNDTCWSLSLDLAGNRHEFILPHPLNRPTNLPAEMRRHLIPITGGRPLLRQPEADIAGNDDGAPDDAGPPDAPAALGRALTELSGQLVTWDLAVRLDLPDAIHQLRVSCRSLRALLRAAAPFLDRGRTEDLNRRLRDLGRRCASARDAEVTAELLPLRAGELRGTVPPDALARLQARALKQLRHASQAARVHLELKEHLHLLADVQAFATDPPFTAKAAGLSSRQLANRVVRRSLRRLERTTAQGPVDPGGGDETLLRHAHDVRKAIKRVRYVALALHSVKVRPRKAVRRKARNVRKYQRELGGIMDAAVLLDWLARTAADLEGEADRYHVGLLQGAGIVRVQEGLLRSEALMCELLALLTGSEQEPSRPPRTG